MALYQKIRVMRNTIDVESFMLYEEVHDFGLHRYTIRQSWLINNDREPRPHFLTIYHHDTPCYYWPSCIHNK